jgi:hypothetical protein
MALVNALSKGIIGCCFICIVHYSVRAGVCGDIRERRVNERVTRQRQELIDTARYFLFVRELTGNNDGKWVEKWQKEAGIKKGDPWCAAFVVSMHNYIGIPIPQSGWSPSLFAANVAWTASDWRKGFMPKPGQVFGIYFESKGRVAHVGIIEFTDGKNVTTIEGNTNGSGSREGDGVYCKIRPLESIWVISDYVGSANRGRTQN